MRSMRTYVILMFGFIAMCASSAFANGTFMVVKGDVKVISKDGKETKAKVGLKIQPTDSIVAGADSRAKIVMTDKNVINVSPDSKIVIEKYVFDEAGGNKEVSLNVMYGKVRAEVNQKYDGEKNKFHVKTPSAVAGVRGTDFLTSYSPKDQSSKIVTFSGKVAVGTPGPGGSIANPVMVNPGQSTTSVAGGAPTKPAPVPKEELVAMNSDTKADPGPAGAESDRAPASEEKKEEKKDEKKDEPKKEEAAKEEPKKEDAKKEEAKADEPKKEEVAKEEPKKEEPVAKKEEPKKEEAKQEAKAEAKAEPKTEAKKEGGDRSPASEKPADSSAKPTTAAKETSPGPSPGPKMVIETPKNSDFPPTFQTPSQPSIPRLPTSTIPVVPKIPDAVKDIVSGSGKSKAVINVIKGN